MYQADPHNISRITPRPAADHKTPTTHIIKAAIRGPLPPRAKSIPKSDQSNLKNNRQWNENRTFICQWNPRNQIPTIRSRDQRTPLSLGRKSYSTQIDLTLKTIDSEIRIEHLTALWVRKWKQLKMEAKNLILDSQKTSFSSSPLSSSRSSFPTIWTTIFFFFQKTRKRTP